MKTDTPIPYVTDRNTIQIRTAANPEITRSEASYISMLLEQAVKEIERKICNGCHYRKDCATDPEMRYNCPKYQETTILD